MTAPTVLYKVLGPGGKPVHGGTGRWHLPKGARPGKWMPRINDPRCCSRGYHLVELSSLAEWLVADCTIFVAEGRGASHAGGDGKTAFGQARLVRQMHISERDLRLFAADCAEHVLPIFLRVRPGDDRPAKAIEAARAYARGEITVAAGVAARAARAAAGVAARAARAAAEDAWAAGVAAEAAAWAAGVAAGDAARAAGVAAWAAGDAAGDAGDAAWDAARAAERAWQAARLSTYLTCPDES